MEMYTKLGQTTQWIMSDLTAQRIEVQINKGYSFSRNLRNGKEGEEGECVFIQKIGKSFPVMRL